MKDTLNTFWSHLEIFAYYELLQHICFIGSKKYKLKKINLIVTAPYKFTIGRKSQNG